MPVDFWKHSDLAEDVGGTPHRSRPVSLPTLLASGLRSGVKAAATQRGDDGPEQRPGAVFILLPSMALLDAVVSGCAWLGFIGSSWPSNAGARLVS